MPHEHDLRYRKLFSNPRIMEVSRMDRSFVTEGFRERESDLIWKLRFQGEEVYLYLLMALRVLRYLSEFYQFLVDSHAVPEDRRLPPVFPLVLYNGDARWTASQQLADLIDPRIGTAFMPSFRYFKLAENEIPRSTLERLNNLVAALFMVETMEPEELAEKVADIVGMLETEHEEEVALFRHWLANFFGSETQPLPLAAGNLMEVKSMLATKLKLREIEWTEKGIEKGREETVKLMARRLQSLGVPIDLIMQATGLSADEIDALKD